MSYDVGNEIVNIAILCFTFKIFVCGLFCSFFFASPLECDAESIAVICFSVRHLGFPVTIVAPRYYSSGEQLMYGDCNLYHARKLLHIQELELKTLVINIFYS